MKRIPILLIVVALIGGVAGLRMLRRDTPGRPADRGQAAGEASPTGRSVPLTLAPLPATLKKTGDFVCNELKLKNGTFTARAEGGSIANVSGGPLTYQFVFTVSAGKESESVQSRFRLNEAQKVPSVTMASKSLQGSVTACALQIVSSEASPAEIQSVNDAAKAAGCGPLARVSQEGTSHIMPPAKGVYSTFPPTSGNHYSVPNGPVPTGVHRDPIADEAQVHNLEHGHVGFQYRDATPAVRAALEAVAGEDSAWIFVAPYPKMSGRVVLTAWTVSIVCATEPVDVDALKALAKAFTAVFRNHGPESIAGTPAS